MSDAVEQRLASFFQGSPIEKQYITVSCTLPPYCQACLHRLLAESGWLQQAAKEHKLTDNRQASANSKTTKDDKAFFEVYGLQQHSGRYCKDLYIAQTKPDNI